MTLAGGESPNNLPLGRQSFPSFAQRLEKNDGSQTWTIWTQGLTQRVFSQAGVEAMIKIIATAGDPSIEMPLTELNA